MVEHSPQNLASALWQHAAHTTDQIISPSFEAGATQKSLSLNKKVEKFSGKKFRRMFSINLLL